MQVSGLSWRVQNYRALAHEGLGVGPGCDFGHNGWLDVEGLGGAKDACEDTLEE